MEASSASHRQAFERLLRRLDLKETGGDDNLRCFSGGAGSGAVTAENRLYGGLVLAQAAVAAGRCFAPRELHALHANFLRPGRPDLDIRYEVMVSKQGRSFDTCTIQAMQQDKPILSMLASFGDFRPAPSHQQPMAEAPEPQGLPNRDALRGRDPAQAAVIDVRLCDPLTGRDPLPPRKRVWLKPVGTVPEDPVLQLGLLVYATDRTFLGTAWRPLADQGTLAGASLDHSLWLHSPARFDDWLLYDMESPVARHERGLVRGDLFQRDGRLLASVAQQGTLTYRPHR
ncbi:MAG: acyl-CoA thioesterase domain-containing protein [Pseudomonadota bacterium]